MRSDDEVWGAAGAVIAGILLAGIIAYCSGRLDGWNLAAQNRAAIGRIMEKPDLTQAERLALLRVALDEAK